VGLFDRFRRKAGEPAPAPAPEPAPEPEPSDAEPEAPPALVAVARRGMSVPTPDYIDAVLAGHAPSAAAAPETIKIGLAQPRWPATPALLDSTVATIVRALGRAHELAGGSSHFEAKGEDGAEVLVVMMWR
jgi:hypothetical protein